MPNFAERTGSGTVLSCCSWYLWSFMTTKICKRNRTTNRYAFPNVYEYVSSWSLSRLHPPHDSILRHINCKTKHLVHFSRTHKKQSYNMTTAKTSNQQLHTTERWQDYCYEDYDYYVDENDYDDFSLSPSSSRSSSGPSYKSTRRQQPQQGKSGGSIYSSKHVRAKESILKRRK
jgi:hypothetical protein